MDTYNSGLQVWTQRDIGGKRSATMLGVGTCIVVGIFLLTRVWLGEGSIVTLHDNRDNEILHRWILSREGRALRSGITLPEVTGGLPRAFLVTGWSLSTVLFAWLSPFWAYVTWQVLGQAVAFASMYLLLRRLGVVEVHALLCALGFGLLPFTRSTAYP